MTRTQANEPGFVQLPDGWLAIEMKVAEAEIAKWPVGLRASFDSLFSAAAPIVPAPAYGVKALEWSEVTEARSDEDPSHEPTGDYEAVTDVGIYYVECGFGSDSYVFSVSLNGDDLSNHDDPVLAKAAAQADFERRILSCLSSAPVEEADAKAGGVEAANVEDILAGLELPDALRAKLAPPPASTIPSEPEAKGEAGAGPVGEARDEGWQPIETAPRDWSDVLLLMRSDMDSCQIVASFDEEPAREGWAWQTWDGPNYHTDTFTHWRPLPAPPQDNREG